MLSNDRMATMLEAISTRPEAVRGSASPAGRVRVECDGSAAALRRVFQEPIARVLARRSDCYEVRLRSGRESGEILAVITATRRRRPLPLFFPEAASLTAEDVERILSSVLEGMGPSFP